MTEGIHSLSAMVTVTFLRDRQWADPEGRAHPSRRHLTVPPGPLGHERPGGAHNGRTRPAQRPACACGPCTGQPDSGYRRWPGWMLFCPFRLRFPDPPLRVTEVRKTPAPQNNTQPGKNKGQGQGQGQSSDGLLTTRVTTTGHSRGKSMASRYRQRHSRGGCSGTVTALACALPGIISRALRMSRVR